MFKNFTIFICMIYFFFLNHCRENKTEKFCDQKSDQFKNELIFRIAIGQTGPFCFFSSLKIATSVGTPTTTPPPMATTKDITAYSIPSLGVTGIITGTTISLSSSTVTSFTPQIATFTTTGFSVSVAGTPQVSGTTANNYSTNLIYTVTAADNSTKTYTVVFTAPRAIGTGLRLWFRAESLALNDGDLVQTWNDESGFNNHLTQATSGTRPQFKTNIVNSLPTVRFITGKRLERTGATLNLNANNGSFFAVFTLNTSIAHVFINLGPPNAFRQYEFSSSIFLMGKSTVGSATVSGLTVPVNTFFNLAIIQNGTSSIQEIWNGDVKATTVPTAQQINYDINNEFSISNTTYIGDVSEWLFFNNTLSQADVNKVNCYLNSKYNLTATANPCGL